jgi:hypothetical protein
MSFIVINIFYKIKALSSRNLKYDMFAKIDFCLSQFTIAKRQLERPERL